MKTLFRFVFVVALLAGHPVQSQMFDPVSWSHSVKQTGEATYEVRLTATMEEDWYLYSQHIDEGGPVPTAIAFDESPDVTLQDSPVEVGVPITRWEAVFDMETTYYYETVEFVQKVEIKSSPPVSLTGTVRFMSCNGEYCTPPLEEKFEISIER